MSIKPNPKLKQTHPTHMKLTWKAQDVFRKTRERNDLQKFEVLK